MCLCTNGFIMVHRSRAFQAVWSIHTDDRPDDDLFLFSILYEVMYQEVAFATNIQAGKDL